MDGRRLLPFNDRACRGWLNVKWNGEAVISGANLSKRLHLGKPGFVLESPISRNDGLNVILCQKTLCPFASNLVDGIEKENSSLSCGPLFGPTDDDACFHRR